MPLITTPNLNQLIADATCALGDTMTIYLNNLKRGNPCECDYKKAKYLFWSLTILNNWEQNASGTDTGKTNYITQEELSNLVKTTQWVIDNTPSTQAALISADVIDFLDDRYL